MQNMSQVKVQIVQKLDWKQTDRKDRWHDVEHQGSR